MKMKRISAFITAAITALTCSLPYSFTAYAETESKLIALTFDDGPNTYTTPKVLDVLEEYDAHASFFLIGDKINDDSAEVVKRAYDMGCEINTHSKTHSYMTELTAEEIAAEMEYVDEYVYSIIGEYPKFFRPPYLSVNQTMYDTIEQPFITGYSSGDSATDATPETIAESVLSNAKDGAIILMHDYWGNDRTVEALKTIMPVLQSQGYEFVTVTELFERQGREPEHNCCYMEVQKYPCSDYALSENLFTGATTGDKDWDGWNEAILLDPEMLESLGDDFAIEVEYESTKPPVIVLHRWKSSEDNLWKAVQPTYYDSNTACFLASDLKAVLDVYGMNYTDMLRIMVRTYITEMTITKVDLLVKNKTEKLAGDVDLDGSLSIADAVSLQKWISAVPEYTLQSMENGDVNSDEKIDIFDLCALKAILISEVSLVKTITQ